MKPLCVLKNGVVVYKGDIVRESTASHVELRYNTDLHLVLEDGGHFIIDSPNVTDAYLISVANRE
jgi:hypothetical protein